MNLIKQMNLFRRKIIFRGDIKMNLRDIVSNDSIGEKTVSLYERMKHADSTLRSLQSSGEWQAARQFRVVFRRACWPGALSTLPESIYKAHIDELVDHCRENRNLQHATNAEMLWSLSSFAESSGISEQAAKAMERCAYRIFGSAVKGDDIVPLFPDRDANDLLTQLRLKIV